MERHNKTQTRLSQATLDALFQYAMALCQQRDNAYDLLQESLEKYLVAVKRGKHPIEHPEAYLRALIRNRFIDSRRHQRRWREQPFEEAAAYDISPIDLEQICISSDTLHAVWCRLDAADRDILYHWAVLGYSTDEVCRELQLPRGTLLSRLHRLRGRLRAEHGDGQLREGP